MLRAKIEYNYKLAVSLLKAWGYDENQVLLGSMPESSLNKIVSLLEKSMGNRQLLGLQVGGFVGITHCHIASGLRQLNEDNVLMTLDPNLMHRGIHNPFSLMVKLAEKFGLTNNSLFITGYSPDQLRVFARLGIRFDFILLDGEHEPTHLLTEIMACDDLLKDQGLMILDDIDHWEGPRHLLANFPLVGYRQIPLTDRAGVLQKLGNNVQDGLYFI